MQRLSGLKNIVVYAGALLVIVSAYFYGYHNGQQTVELKWTKEREVSLQAYIGQLKEKERKIESLQRSIVTLNDSAMRVRDKDAELQRRLQTELRDCSKFRRALESCSATLSRCAEHAVADRKIIEWCAIQLK